MDSTALRNHQIRLAARPVGLPTRDNWSFTTEAVAEPGPGGVLLKTLSLSLDPAMRGWMNEGKSYIPPVEINAGSLPHALQKIAKTKTKTGTQCTEKSSVQRMSIPVTIQVPSQRNGRSQAGSP